MSRILPSGTIACIVIARGDRGNLLDELVMPSVVSQDFDEIVLVGEHHSGEGYRHLPVPDITRTTVDALIKRDVGTLATTSEWLIYLCDDHRLDTSFNEAFQQFSLAKRSIGVPARITNRGPKTVGLNTGFKDGYCGGHAGIYHRDAVRELPFTIAPHHPNWDVFHSRMLMGRGYKLVELPDCMIEDIEGGEPWR